MDWSLARTVVAGLVSSSLMLGGFILFVMRRRARMLGSNTGPRPGYSPRQISGVTMAPLEVAQALAVRGLEAAAVNPLGWPHRTVVRGYTPIRISTWGSLVTVWLAEVPGGTVYTIESRPVVPAALFDSHRNEQIVNIIAWWMNSTTSDPATLLPPPP